MYQTTAPAEAVDGAIQGSVNAGNIAQMVPSEECPRSLEDISSPSSPGASSQLSTRSQPRGRKRTAATTPQPESEKRKKKSTGDREQDELLANAKQLMDDSLTVQDISFVLDQFARERDNIASKSGNADDTDQYEPQQQDLGCRQRWLDGLGVHKKGER